MTQANGSGGLAAALVKAQAEFPSIPKNKKTTIPLKNGGHREYNYADLASILDATRPALTKNNLAITQPMTLASDGSPILRTRLLHVSGEVLESDYLLPKGVGSQEMGSAITYGRRYSIQAILGISADDDDDGETAQNAHNRPQTDAKKVYRVPAPSKPAAPVQEPLVVPDGPPSQPSDPADDRSWETVTILKVASKQGNTNGKPWTRFGIFLGYQDGSEGWVNTFDTDYGAVASSLQGGKLARVALKPGKPYKGQNTTDLVGIEPMEEDNG